MSWRRERWSKQIPVGVFFALLILVVISLVLIKIFNSSVNCQKLIDQSNSLIQKNQAKQAYSMLKMRAQDCSSNISTNTTKSAIQKSSQSIQYSSNYALAAFQQGDNATAIQYANQTLNNARQLPTATQQQIPNLISTGLQMNFILREEGK